MVRRDENSGGDPEGSAGGADKGRPSARLVFGASAALVRALAAGERNVNELARATGLSQPNVSNHLARLRRRGMVVSHRAGRQVRYQLAGPEVTQLLPPAGSNQEGHAPQPGELAARFLETALANRVEEAEQAIDDAVRAGTGWRELYFSVFSPALEEVGRRWAAGELSVAAEHLVTGVVLRLMHRHAPALPGAPRPEAPSALIGCVEGELHTVGIRMAASSLQARGWRAWFLEGPLPAAEWPEAAARHRPDVVLIGVTTAERREALDQTVAALCAWRGQRRRPLLVAGGRYFSEPRTVPGLDAAGADLDGVITRVEARLARRAG